MTGSKTSRRVSAARRVLQRGLAGAGGLWLTAGAAAAANFKQAPRAAEAQDQGPETILGIIEINTAFFIAVGVIAFFWFVFGGGRKAKVGNAPPK